MQMRATSRVRPTEAKRGRKRELYRNIRPCNEPTVLKRAMNVYKTEPFEATPLRITSILDDLVPRTADKAGHQQLHYQLHADRCWPGLDIQTMLEHRYR